MLTSSHRTPIHTSNDDLVHTPVKIKKKSSLNRSCLSRSSNLSFSFYYTPKASPLAFPLRPENTQSCLKKITDWGWSKVKTKKNSSLNRSCLSRLPNLSSSFYYTPEGSPLVFPVTSTRINRLTGTIQKFRTVFNIAARALTETALTRPLIRKMIKTVLLTDEASSEFIKNKRRNLEKLAKSDAGKQTILSLINKITPQVESLEAFLSTFINEKTINEWVNLSAEELEDTKYDFKPQINIVIETILLNAVEKLITEFNTEGKEFNLVGLSLKFIEKIKNATNPCNDGEVLKDPKALKELLAPLNTMLLSLFFPNEAKDVPIRAFSMQLYEKSKDLLGGKILSYAPLIFKINNNLIEQRLNLNNMFTAQGVKEGEKELLCIENIAKEIAQKIFNKLKTSEEEKFLRKVEEINLSDFYKDDEIKEMAISLINPFIMELIFHFISNISKKELPTPTLIIAKIFNGFNKDHLKNSGDPSDEHFKVLSERILKLFCLQKNLESIPISFPLFDYENPALKLWKSFREETVPKLLKDMLDPHALNLMMIDCLKKIKLSFEDNGKPVTPTSNLKTKSVVSRDSVLDTASEKLLKECTDLLPPFMAYFVKGAGNQISDKIGAVLQGKTLIELVQDSLNSENNTTTTVLNETPDVDIENLKEKTEKELLDLLDTVQKLGVDEALKAPFKLFLENWNKAVEGVLGKEGGMRTLFKFLGLELLCLFLKWVLEWIGTLVKIILAYGLNKYLKSKVQSMPNGIRGFTNQHLLKIILDALETGQPHSL